MKVLQFLIVVVSGLLAIPLLVVVHQTLDRICARHAQAFCRKSGLDVRRVRLQPARDSSGVKTEFTIVQLDCLDLQKQRKIVEVLVWPFGFRKMLRNEDYPLSLDESWK